MLHLFTDKAVCLAHCVFEVFVQHLGLGKAGNLASCGVVMVLLQSSWREGRVQLVNQLLKSGKLLQTML